MSVRKRVGVLISGRGSNMMALAAAARDADYPADIVCVVSNRPEAEGLKHAAAMGIATKVIDHRAYGSREAFEAALNQYLQSQRLDFIALAGFMRVLTPGFIEAWRDRTINIHPSLLPAYRGFNTHARALAGGAAEHGCTVHIVRAELDSGPIIAQAKVPVFASDTAETLAARVLIEEHRLYPHALALLASGRIRIEGNQVKTSS
jgi:phosphoribosylglycinamide formyltransferase 1